MTEAEWMAATDPTTMLEHLGGGASDRKLRLFLCACFYTVWDAVPAWCRAAVGVAERFADGAATEQDRRAAERELARAVLRDRHSTRAESWLIDQSAWAARACLSQRVMLNRGARFPLPERPAVRLTTIVDEATGMEAVPNSGAHAHFLLSWYAELLRDLVGNPFAPVAVNPAWLTTTVVAVAGQLYDSRSFSAMPILADALQDAGCEDREVLLHCRGPGPHCRGCWLVDAILGKK